MDTAQWPQGIGVVVQLPMDGNNNSDGVVSDHQRNNNIQNKRAISAPRPLEPINCPRCNSTNTKFCYYNNYSLNQPRYFCKACKRYWTEGGSLRNVPVGGASRKKKRSSSSSSSISSSKKLSENNDAHQNPNMKIFHGGQDLNLGFPEANSSYNPNNGIVPGQFVEFTNPTTSAHTNFSQFLKSGISGARGFSPFMSMIPVSDSNTSGLPYSSSISESSLPFQEFSKTSGLNFSINHPQIEFDNSGNHQGGYGSSSLQQAVHQENVNTSSNHAKLFNFPIEDLKQPAVVSNTATSHGQSMEHNGGNHHQENDHLQASSLIWNNGGLGGGASW